MLTGRTIALDLVTDIWLLMRFIELWKIAHAEANLKKKKKLVEELYQEMRFSQNYAYEQALKQIPMTLGASANWHVITRKSITLGKVYSFTHNNKRRFGEAIEFTFDYRVKMVVGLHTYIVKPGALAP